MDRKLYGQSGDRLILSTLNDTRGWYVFLKNIQDGWNERGWLFDGTREHCSLLCPNEMMEWKE